MTSPRLSRPRRSDYPPGESAPATARNKLGGSARSAASHTAHCALAKQATSTSSYLAAALLNHDPQNPYALLRALFQRCHMR
jgi:hypothetical protein